MRVLAISLLFVLLSFGQSKAQDNIVGFNLKAYTLTSSFNNNIESTPIGISGSFMRSIEDSRFSIGIEAGIASYSSEEYIMDYQQTKVNAIEENGFITFHAFVRYELIDLGWSRFYGEGKLGTTLFYTSIMASHCPVADELEYEGEFNTQSGAFNMGLGGGMLLNPTIFSNYDAESAFWIDFGVTSYAGSLSSYNVVTNDENSSNLKSQTNSTLTHYIDYRIGLIFIF